MTDELAWGGSYADAIFERDFTVDDRVSNPAVVPAEGRQQRRQLVLGALCDNGVLPLGITCAVQLGGQRGQYFTAQPGITNPPVIVTPD
ncbi:MAG TPA: hypothetical protein VMM60_12735 [Ilumatobacter sp.]|nr:hypothetical protein [Ilumatobacter sp.]